MRKEPEYIIDYIDFTPSLSSNIVVSKFDSSNYLVENAGRFLKLSDANYQLLKLVDGKRNILEIGAELSGKLNIIIRPDYIYNLLYFKFSEYGIIESEKSIKEKNKTSYLQLRFIIFNTQTVSYFSNYLSAFFSPIFFYISGVIMIIFCMSFLASNYLHIVNFEVWTHPKRLILYIIITLIITLFHELGHATACRKFGAKHGGIGFGFYLLSPVFFADVTDAWRLKRYQRIIVNLAGTYMELLFITLFFLLFTYTGIYHFFYLGLLLAIDIGINLNPLLRYDGYWVLSDSINVPNLRKQSILRIKLFIKFLFRKIKNISFTFKDWFLLIYAAITYIFLFFFVSFIVLYDPFSIIYFPINFLDFLIELIFQHRFYNWSWIFHKLESLFVPLLFYYLLFNLCVGYLTRRLSLRKSVNL